MALRMLLGIEPCRLFEPTSLAAASVSRRENRDPQISEKERDVQDLKVAGVAELGDLALKRVLGEVAADRQRRHNRKKKQIFRLSFGGHRGHTGPRGRAC